jgi:trimeric autotransporter adhesin
MRNTLGFLLLSTICITAHGQANTKLSNLVAPTAVNADLLPGTTNTRSLGSSNLSWKNLYLRGDAYLDGTRFLSNAPGVPSANTFVGAYSGTSITTGTNNTAVGHNALLKINSGSYNTAVGSGALNASTYAVYNTAVGYMAISKSSGAANTAVGYNALRDNTTGDNNTAMGYQAMLKNISGYMNTALGSYALVNNTTGTQNVAIGRTTLINNNGTQNTAVGNDCMTANTSGSFNTALGYRCLSATSTSQYNTALGYLAGYSKNNGYNNIFVGANTDVNGSGYFNVIVIGQGTIGTSSSQVTIGNPATTSYRAYAGWSNISDGRFKRNVKDNVPGLVFINKLRPVTYNLDAKGLDQFLNSSRSKENEMNGEARALMDKALREKEALMYTGFVAQEVERAAKELGYEFSGVEQAKNEKDVYALKYSDFVVPLVKAAQELSAADNQLKEEVSDLKKENKQLKEELAELRQMVLDLKNAVTNSSLNTFKAYLEQSTPNPTQGTVLIHYYVPQNSRTANLVFTDIKGAILKSLTISTKGAGQLTINTVAWAAGTYTYTLYINGTQTDSKKLVVAR